MNITATRAILTLASFLTFVLLMLHFPFEGYGTQTVLGGFVETTCPSWSKEKTCGFHAPIIANDLPFLAWNSIGALVDWAAPVKSMLAAISVIWGAAAAALIATRGR